MYDGRAWGLAGEDGYPTHQLIAVPDLLGQLSHDPDIQRRVPVPPARERLPEGR